jgi:beta-N-acetylhexosaminidase
MSDDLSMKALAGPMRSRAESVIAAGSDVALHCNGELAEMVEAAAGVPDLNGVARQRFELAYAVTGWRQPFDAMEAERLMTMAEVAHAAAAESV